MLLPVAPAAPARALAASGACASVSSFIGAAKLGPVTIDSRRTADEEELFRLYAEVFGTSMTEASRRRWRWQYLDNPHTNGGPAIWVARDDAGVLGQYASMPVRLFWAGREVDASWGMDVFVRGEARGRGVGAALFTTWSDHVPVALGLGLTPSSYGLFRKLRYDDVGPVPFYFRPLDARALMRRRLGPVLGDAAGLAVDLGLRVWRPDTGGTHPGLHVRKIDAFPADTDALWERARGGYAMCVRRDRAYLDWKYARCPHQRYELGEVRRGGALAGWAVTRVQGYRGVRLGWIVDVFTAAEDGDARDALLGAVLDGFRAAGVARAQAFAMNQGLGTALRRRGFLQGRSPMQFCVRAQVDSGDVLARRGDWHVVFGDSDMDR
jgi:GNAT superfamily N-acetyltransferase